MTIFRKKKGSYFAYILKTWCFIKNWLEHKEQPNDGKMSMFRKKKGLVVVNNGAIGIQATESFLECGRIVFRIHLATIL